MMLPEVVATDENMTPVQTLNTAVTITIFGLSLSKGLV